MEFVDYYKILGIDKKASAEEIKKAYRKLARTMHPDLNPNDAGAKKKFQEINEANEVLSDPEKRKKYDQYGKDWEHADQFEQAKQSRQGQPFSGGGTYTGGEGDYDFSDFFSAMFGDTGGSRRQAKFKGQDYNAEWKMSLEEAYTTHPQTLTVNGKNIRITIPAGVENGQVIRLKGYGAPGSNGGPSGDLYLTFNITPNAVFKRLGNDLYTTREIDLYTALLGGEILQDTLGGKLKLTIKPETQNGTKIRLKAKGFPVYKKEGEFGDLYITLQVKLPTNLSDTQKELIRQLSAS